jgi:hypothetical protein
VSAFSPQDAPRCFSITHNCRLVMVKNRNIESAMKFKIALPLYHAVARLRHFQGQKSVGTGTYAQGKIADHIHKSH